MSAIGDVDFDGYVFASQFLDSQRVLGPNSHLLIGSIQGWLQFFLLFVFGFFEFSSHLVQITLSSLKYLIE